MPSASSITGPKLRIRVRLGMVGADPDVYGSVEAYFDALIAGSPEWERKRPKAKKEMEEGKKKVKKESKKTMHHLTTKYVAYIPASPTRLSKDHGSSTEKEHKDGKRRTRSARTLAALSSTHTAAPPDDPSATVNGVSGKGPEETETEEEKDPEETEEEMDPEEIEEEKDLEEIEEEKDSEETETDEEKKDLEEKEIAEDTEEETEEETEEWVESTAPSNY